MRKDVLSRIIRKVLISTLLLAVFASMAYAEEAAADQTAAVETATAESKEAEPPTEEPPAEEPAVVEPAVAEALPVPTPVVKPLLEEPVAVEKAPVEPDKTAVFAIEPNTVGFGFGINAPVAGDAAPFKIGSKASIRWWISDYFALEPLVKIYVDYTEDEGTREEDISYRIGPGVMLVFAVFRGNSIRLNTGIGLALNIEGISSSIRDDYGIESELKEKTVGFDIPVMLGLEHFFIDWFSINVGVEFDLLSYDKSENEVKRPGEDRVNSEPVHNVKFDIDSTNLFINLMFYTN